MRAERITPLRAGASQEAGGICRAYVVDISDQQLLLELDGKTVPARAAFSCLVCPEPGDYVLLSEDTQTGVFVLAVLERNGEQHMTLAAPADLRIKAPQGGLQLLARQDVTVSSADRLSMLGRRLLLKGEESHLGFGRATVSGEEATVSVSMLRLVSRQLETYAKSLVQTLRNYTRRTDGHDSVEGGNMTRRTRGLFSMRSRNAVITSKKDMRIDAKRIHMG